MSGLWPLVSHTITLDTLGHLPGSYDLGSGLDCVSGCVACGNLAVPYVAGGPSVRELL